MPTYTVTWSIEGSHIETEVRHVDGDSPLEAGHLALAAHGHTDTEIGVTVVDEDTGKRRTFLVDDYARIALRLWAAEEWRPPFSREEAVIIATGWASEHFCPKLCEWVNGVDVPVEQLVADAHELWENLGINTECWPYEGEPWPSIRAVASLTHYLEQHRDEGTKP
ncbi:hypothetical protein ACFVVM_32615 [Nocardia sp. NPDC058176]|uniref:hypothetical protein n=1 Tax=Nocardia sp. NPDC058176 TaxID=3346368 RepID=UPI0036DB6C54